MYNIVMLKDFTAAGVSNVIIRQALTCCLLKLGRGIYSVTSNCGRLSHRRIASFIDDSEWIAFHESRPRDSLAGDYAYQDLLLRIRTLSYPRYRPDDVLIGVSAAALHEIPLFGVNPFRPITVSHPSCNSRSSELIRRRRHLDPADTASFDHVSATAAIRTCFDLSSELGQRTGFAALEYTLRTSLLGRVSPEGLKFGYPDNFLDIARSRVVRDYFPVIDRLTTGNATASRMANAINPQSESIAESYCSFNLHALNILGFEQQVRIFDARGYIQRVDFLDESRKTIIEVDGIEKSVQGGREQVSRQSYQHNKLLAVGYTVVRFRFSELFNLHDFATKLFAQAPQLKSRVSVSV